VVAVDGSEIAAEAVHAIRYWPFLSAAEIAVLSIAPSTALVARYAGHAELAADELRSVGLDAQPEVRTGEAAHGIVSFAETWDADLIVTGSHGRTGLSRLVLGSVARNVLHHAACSVLIVKRHAAAVPVGEPALVGPAWTMAAAR
jgi:nucleotide-binding universal stress UspA family protein